MSAKHPTESHLNETDDRAEVAGAKLWSIYVSEAEKYDKGLVESWKADMEGLLIFAGLFSAILTAFIIESYKNLSQDPGATTIAVLVQISQQLDPKSNASSVDISALTAFTPTASTLVCNTL
ncbi:hypothetical protein DFH09DRAFT_967247, partial [Mycena vulgaris]